MGDMEREIAKKQLEQSIVELLMKVVKLISGKVMMT